MTSMKKLSFQFSLTNRYATGGVISHVATMILKHTNIRFELKQRSNANISKDNS